MKVQIFNNSDLEIIKILLENLRFFYPKMSDLDIIIAALEELLAQHQRR